ncbi:MAG: hypothetical protein NC236_03035 [Mycoplasma sp.]|nr:hypothetical protein [Mycoplasma sp.]
MFFYFLVTTIIISKTNAAIPTNGINDSSEHIPAAIPKFSFSFAPEIICNIPITITAIAEINVNTAHTDEKPKIPVPVAYKIIDSIKLIPIIINW